MALVNTFVCFKVWLLNFILSYIFIYYSWPSDSKFPLAFAVLGSMSPLILKSNYKEYSNLGCSSHPFPGLWMYGIIHLLHMTSLETSGHLLWVNSRSLYGSFCGAGVTLRTSCRPGKCSTTKLHAQANLTPFFLLFLEFSLSNTFHGFIILWRGCFLLKK